METTSDFCSFREEDFHLFRGDCTSDRRFNKNRLDLKERIRRIGEKLSACMPAGWTMESGTEHPAVWNRQQVDRLELFFLRGEEERRRINRAVGREIPMSLLLQSPSPLYAHASLGFFIYAHGIEAGFRVPFLAVGDRHQLRKIMEAASAGSLQISLDEGRIFGVFSGDQLEEFPVDSPRGWLAALSRLEEVGTRDHRAYLGLVWRFSPQESAGENFPGKLESCLSRLAAFAQNHVWSTTNDLLGVDGLIQAQNRINQSQWERSEKERQELVSPKPVVARPILSSQDTPAAAFPKPSSAPAAVQAPRPKKAPLKKPAQPRPAAPPQPGQEDASSLASRAAGKSDSRPARRPASKPLSLQPAKNLAPGDTVVLASGLFAGKDAIVLDILSDGQVRVRVGMMQLLVNSADLQQRAQK